MSSWLLHKLARFLGCTATYPDWYMVRHLLREKLRALSRGAMQTRVAALLREPGRVLRCTLAGMPELKLFPDASTRNAALSDFGTSMRDARDWRYWVVLGFMTALSAGAGFAAGHLAEFAPFAAFGAANYLLRLAAMIITFWLLLRTVQRIGAALRLRLTLVALGVPVCIGCGYSLMGHDESAQRCPECGRTIDERARALLMMTGEPDATVRPADEERREAA